MRMPTSSIIQEEEPGRSPIPAVPGTLTHLSRSLCFLCTQARARWLLPRSLRRPHPGPEAPTCGPDAAPAAPGSTRNASTSATWTSSG